MGWSRGTDVCISVWEAVRHHIPEHQRSAVLAKVMLALTDADWDCCDEIEDMWPESLVALKIVNKKLGVEEE
jgi:hypothetical protein